ncbi:pyridoxal-5'-phosphate-dependent protein subunit beta [Hirschia litorea]|uniref:Pyridoxal-5'-phosphate-dependent protein subunit beta n=1 Tax=Hirschia litorea TaxID=1199156 RepID=A0ABW2IGN2_9PROT
MYNNANRLALTERMLERRAPVLPHEFHCSQTRRKICFDVYHGDKLGLYLSGNKILKLAPNIHDYLSGQDQQLPLATFGGSYSNHLRAYSALTRMLRIRALAFVRESPKGTHLPLVKTMTQRGVQVHLLSPEDFKHRESPQFLSNLVQTHGSFHLITEGGTSPSSVRHIAEVFAPLRGKYTHAFVPVGLGGTLAGVAAGLGASTKVIGVSALKSDFTLTDRVKAVLGEAEIIDPNNWAIDYGYHFGGFGKTKPELLNFADTFQKQTQIELYATYTMKSAYAMIEYAKQGKLGSALWVNTFNPV